MIDFTEVEQSVRDLKVQFTTGHIDEKTFESRLLDLVDIADDGHYWMFGHETERWYRYDGQKWIPDTPTRVSGRAPEDSPAPRTGAAAGQDRPLPSPATERQSLNVSWFITSLVVIGAIGGLVYYSAAV